VGHEKIFTADDERGSILETHKKFVCAGGRKIKKISYSHRKGGDHNQGPPRRERSRSHSGGTHQQDGVC